MDIDRFITSLFEARDYYQNIITHAVSQLEHINALIDDVGGSEHSLNTTSHSRLKIGAHSLSESVQDLPPTYTNGAVSNLSTKTDFEKSNQSSQEAEIELKEVKEPSVVSEAQTEVTLPQTSPAEDRSSTASLSDREVTDTTDEESASSDDSEDNPFESEDKPQTNEKITQKTSKASESNKKGSSNARNKRFPQRPRSINIPFVPKLEGMKLGDAIFTILQETPNTVSHTDYIVRAIYGELEGNTLRTAKDRVTKELSRGYILGRWYRLPDTPGYYTISKQLTETRRGK
ncbi:hypothetical protein G7B40_009870 [Aetokthonos hydrillicola Thurmond2011]|jgi:hypothetical protein|uniref:Uncharacterized protein n=1 Tax=Aetokthonos hydrillicola Thurmond2011 TaxID=2712845 RepID=A0AAP5I9E1_9CYAN|nr:hypothetical protein [Aetokthonos hydrillicola]MBO3464157.1 hypothetical protein [Aetokthonos hydrillicola CCALA 1050]MBW4590077.1 hypothetical protein [Aetokthonos hydrillicola CCALA 1050]MDR9894870.1 hypothetical protein [Aetokthonos hydrillicola Thurmond2011]